MFKICTKCGLEQRVEDYYKKSNGLHGRHSECKACMCARDKVIRDKRSDTAKRLKNRKDWIRKRVLDELARLETID